MPGPAKTQLLEARTHQSEAKAKSWDASELLTVTWFSDNDSLAFTDVNDIIKKAIAQTTPKVGFKNLLFIIFKFVAPLRSWAVSFRPFVGFQLLLL